jgi:hypothetical protein
MRREVPWFPALALAVLLLLAFAACTLGESEEKDCTRTSNVKQGAPLAAKGRRPARQHTIPIEKRLEPRGRLRPRTAGTKVEGGTEGKVSRAASCFAAGRRCGPGLCADSKM